MSDMGVKWVRKIRGQFLLVHLPLTTDKRVSIQEFILHLKRRKELKKKVKPTPKKDDNIVSFSPLTIF